MQRIEIANSGIKKADSPINDSDLKHGIITSIVDTVKALTEPSALTDLGLSKQKEGLVILIDEADVASKQLNLGSFLKNLSESLVAEDCNKLLLILSGLPTIRDILRDSHESSLRLFEELILVPLSHDEVYQVIKKGIDGYNEKQSVNKITIEEDALKLIYNYSEGYPHFVQQIGASALAINDDNIITKEDVQNGMFNPKGALDLIGDRYYKDLFFNRINTDSYREILKIMATRWNQWITKEEIRKEFSGKDETLNNGLKALRDRNIILDKEGTKGEYRLQWASFAFWIRSYSQS